MTIILISNLSQNLLTKKGKDFMIQFHASLVNPLKQKKM